MLIQPQANQLVLIEPVFKEAGKEYSHQYNI